MSRKFPVLKAVRFLLLLQFVFFQNCTNFNDCLRKKSQTEQLTIPLEFTANITTKDYFNVEITQDTANELIIEGPEHLIAKIETHYTDNRLVVENADPCKMLRNPEDVINLHFRISDADSLHFSTYVNLSIPDTFQTDSLQIFFAGKISECDISLKTLKVNLIAYSETGNYLLKGEGVGFSVSMLNGSKLDAGNFRNRWVVANNYGRNTMTLRAYSTLIANIYGQGNVYYYDNPPRLEAHEYGSGKLIPVE